MSFRELRNFSECMRALGYTRSVSLDSFRKPNFPLVADVLHWLAKRYDPSIDVPVDVATEAERVLFLKQIARSFITRAHIKLNLKKLYQADGYAVKELLKLAQLLKRAMDSGISGEDIESVAISASSSAADVKAARQLTSEITTRGAELFELLGVEHELRELRHKVLSRPFELDDVEKTVAQMTQKVRENLEEYRERLEQVNADEKNLDTKIEKKKADLDRSSKRLASLQQVRPAFMDQYEKLELEMQKYFNAYLERYRNLEYLENEVEKHNQRELEKKKATERKLENMRKRLQEEELRILRGVEMDMDGDDGLDFGRDGEDGEGSFVDSNDLGSESELELDDDSDGFPPPGGARPAGRRSYGTSDSDGSDSGSLLDDRRTGRGERSGGIMDEELGVDVDEEEEDGFPVHRTRVGGGMYDDRDLLDEDDIGDDEDVEISEDEEGSSFSDHAF